MDNLLTGRYFWYDAVGSIIFWLLCSVVVSGGTNGGGGEGLQFRAANVFLLHQ